MPTIYFEGVHKALPKCLAAIGYYFSCRAAALPVAAP